MEQFPRRVLIVDDNDGVRLAIRIQLEAVGLLCQEAENGLQALSMLSTQSVDVVLTDLEMPHMNGLQLIHTLSENDSCGSPRILLMSAWLTEDMRETVLQSGADAVLDKPFSASDLMAALQTPQDHLPQAA